MVSGTAHGERDRLLAPPTKEILWAQQILGARAHHECNVVTVSLAGCLRGVKIIGALQPSPARVLRGRRLIGAADGLGLAKLDDNREWG